MGLLAACGSGGSGTSDAQTPPTSGMNDVESWLSAGSYKSWRCEQAPHGPLSPSPHLRNRICSNTLLSGAGAGEYPVGSAAVKELFDGTGATLRGYAVYLHTRAGKTGDTWYWYERDGGPVADGFGDSGPAKTICVGCHSQAGSDAAHPGHDFVYVQVR